MTKPQTIFRVVKNQENPYVMMDKRPIQNRALSWRAKGLLAYLLSKPDDWSVQFTDLVNHAPDGDFIVRQTIKELVKAGHMKKRQVREKGKITQWVWDVYEVPFLFREVQQVEKPQIEDRALNNIDSTNTDNVLIDNESTPTEYQPAADFPVEKKKATVKKQKTPRDPNKPYTYPAHLREHALAFEQLMKRGPQQAEYGLWLFGSKENHCMGIRDFVETGITVQEMKQAFSEMEADHLTIGNPNSIFKVASDVHRRNTSYSGQTKQDTQEIERLRKQAEKDFAQ